MFVTAQSPLNSVRFAGDARTDSIKQRVAFSGQIQNDRYVTNAPAKQAVSFGGWLNDFLTMPAVVRKNPEAKELAKKLVEGNRESLKAVDQLVNLKASGLNTLHDGIVDYARDKVVDQFAIEGDSNKSLILGEVLYKMGALPDLLQEYNVLSDFTKKSKHSCVRGLPSDGQAIEDKNRANKLKAVFHKLMETQSLYRADVKDQCLNTIKDNGLTRAAVRIMIRFDLCEGPVEFGKVIGSLTKASRSSESAVKLAGVIPYIVKNAPFEDQSALKKAAMQVLDDKIESLGVDKCEEANALLTACMKARISLDKV